MMATLRMSLLYSSVQPGNAGKRTGAWTLLFEVRFRKPRLDHFGSRRSDRLEAFVSTRRSEVHIEGIAGQTDRY